MVTCQVLVCLLFMCFSKMLNVNLCFSTECTIFWCAFLHKRSSFKSPKESTLRDGVKTHLLSWCNQPIARVQKPSISYLVSTFGGQVACYLLSCFVLKMNHIFGRFLHDFRSVWVFLFGSFTWVFFLGFFTWVFCLGYLGLRYANKKMFCFKKIKNPKIKK